MVVHDSPLRLARDGEASSGVPNGQPRAAADPAAIRVLVADDQPLFRGALVRALGDRAGLVLVGETAGGRAALAQIRALRPDVAVIDVALADLDGVRVLEAVRREGLPTAVVFLSADLGRETAYRAIEAGAAGYLSKGSTQDEITDAVAAAARGAIVLSPDVNAGLAAEIRLRARHDRAVLSPRERQVLALVAEGMSAPRIARSLHLSTGTVKTHLSHLYEKLAVSDRAACVAEAMRRGLLD